jgi:hypothetical protein
MTPQITSALELFEYARRRAILLSPAFYLEIMEMVNNSRDGRYEEIGIFQSIDITFIPFLPDFIYEIKREFIENTVNFLLKNQKIAAQVQVKQVIISGVYTATFEIIIILDNPKSENWKDAYHEQEAN